MDYEALVDLLELQKYRKAIINCTITLMKHSKSRNHIEVFLCVEETWNYELYTAFKNALSKLTGCEISMQFMATNTKISAHDITLYINDLVNKDGCYNIFKNVFPLIENDKLICSFPKEKTVFKQTVSLNR